MYLLGLNKDNSFDLVGEDVIDTPSRTQSTSKSESITKKNLNLADLYRQSSATKAFDELQDTVITALHEQIRNLDDVKHDIYTSITERVFGASDSMCIDKFQLLRFLVKDIITFKYTLKGDEDGNTYTLDKLQREAVIAEDSEDVTHKSKWYSLESNTHTSDIPNNNYRGINLLGDSLLTRVYVPNFSMATYKGEDFLKIRSARFMDTVVVLEVIKNGDDELLILKVAEAMYPGCTPEQTSLLYAYSTAHTTEIQCLTDYSIVKMLGLFSYTCENLVSNYTEFKETLALSN